MWCKNCNKNTTEKICAQCGQPTLADIPLEIQWCDHCKVPIIKEINDKDKDACPLCGQKTKYLCKDIRPVFPEERLLIEILIGKPLAWLDKTVWCNNNRYYIDGKAKTISFSQYNNEEIIQKVIREIGKYSAQNNDINFYKSIVRFCDANKSRFYNIANEAKEFINFESAKYGLDQIAISFSGGKDSTVVADLVTKALSNPYLVHIYGDTTLEFPLSYEYVARYRKNNPKAIVRTAKNREQEFYDVCEDIGPPARMMRWCCTMFKTGPITRTINSLFKDKKILTYYGIRKSESLSRRKYD